jgi:hypothetical protein
MKTDRTETNDLAVKYPKRVKELNDLWWAWGKRCDVLPMNPNHKGEFLKRRIEAQKRKQQRLAKERKRKEQKALDERKNTK